MTPAARIAAAIEVLDRILDGQAVEPALSGWGRANRFAGSKDRAAIRDHVFDVLRCKRSFAWLGGAETGRGLMLGACRARGVDPAEVFDGSRYGPAAPSPQEVGRDLNAAPRGVCLDMPDWLLPHFDGALEDPDAAMMQLQTRAGVFLRVNLRRCSKEEAAEALAGEGIATRGVSGVRTALEVTENHRKIAQSAAYRDGKVELQDPSSQQAVLALPLQDGMRVLDLCAGGGGKALAMAALADLDLTCHDIDRARMRDLPARAARAGVDVTLAEPGQIEGLFDLVLVDAPCSGSGTWRRTPQAKWDLTPDRLSALTQIQDEVLAQAFRLAVPGGWIAYATCSVFRCENEDRVAAALRSAQGVTPSDQLRLCPEPTHDGFYLSVIHVKR